MYRNCLLALLCSTFGVVSPAFAQVKAVAGDEPAGIGEREPGKDPAEAGLDDIESVIEEAGGETDFVKWTDGGFAFRRIVTLTPVPQFERTEVVAIGGLSLKRLAEYGQLGSGVVARTGAGEALELLSDETNDVCAVRLPEAMRTRSHVQLAIYYGDGKSESTIKPLGRPLSGPELKAYQCFLGTEETRDGDKSDVAPKSIERYAHLTVVEPKTPKKPLALAGAHGGQVTVLSDNNGMADFDRFELPAGGNHIRVRLYSPNHVDAKLELLLSAGEADRYIVPLNASGEGFFWAETTAKLHGSPMIASVRGKDTAGLAVDCLTFTPDANWRPDYASISGPMWVRFRFRDGAESVESLDLTATHTTYTENGPISARDGGFSQNVWFQTAGMRTLFPKRRLKTHFTSGQWTPWGRLRERGSWTWFETVSLKGKKPLPAAVDVQFAFEPYAGAVFRQETAGVDDAGDVRFRMPMTPDDFNDAITYAHTFEGLVDKRAGWVKQANLTGKDQPRELAFSVFLDSELTESMHAKTLAMMRAVGFNGVDQHNPKYDDDYAKANFNFHHEHCWIQSLDADWDNLPGTTYVEKLASYRKEVLEKTPTWRAALDAGRFNILGDEIGPAVDEGSMRADPRLHRLFVLFATEHGAKPEMFGVKSWDEISWPVSALGRRERKIERLNELQRLAAEAVSDQALGEKGADELVLDEAEEAAIKAKKKAAATQRIEDVADQRVDKRRNEGVVVVPDPKSDAGRRLKWYVRLFQSDFTARTYNAHAEAIYNRSKVKTVSGPNFQAEPAWSGRMWDGGLDIFTYGRLGGPYTMVQIEDWLGNDAFANCAYSGALIRAACRTSNAFPAALVTGGQTRPKLIAWLSQGIRKFDSYTYGPIYRIGPVWADDRDSYKNIGDTLGAIARMEDDVLACLPKNDVALLVANTTEITAKSGGMNRIAMFAELTYAGYQPDIVSEDDILTDKRLANYKALVVVDEAVRKETQEAIAAWAAQGGKVYVVPGAAACDQFEQPTPMLAKLRQADAKGADLRKQLTGFMSSAGARLRATADREDVWLSTAEGEGRQVIYAVWPTGAPPAVNVPHATKPREVVSGLYGPIKDVAFEKGEIRFNLPTESDDRAAGGGDIIVIRD